MTSSPETEEYVMINNIPKDYHASHLRNFFSSFIESGGFLCFHYRHRPEVQKPSNNSCDSDPSRRVTNCCIVKMAPERIDEFIKQYNGEHWLDCKGETLMTCCFIKKVKFSDVSDFSYSSESLSCKQGTVAVNVPLHKEDISKDDVNSLIEMHPPSFMPNGNVGTKTSHFMNEIRACRLPPSLITKLGLEFPRNRSRRIYGNVPLEYKKRTFGPAFVFSKERIRHNISNNKKAWCSRSTVKNSKQEDRETDEESESEEEEWDRHESLHDDVSGQERNKERLFEEKIELKWEKGGSGLVFYTDAQHWDAKEGDFDAKTSDDWDIDTRIYSHSGPDTDKDMRDLVRLRLEKKLRKGIATEKDSRYDFAAFEKYNKGFSRKLMESQGWKQGEGIGKNAGISEPIPSDGQHPADKKGFGYRGEKLERHPKRERRKRRHLDSDEPEYFHISTVYDNPEISDPPESVLVSSSFSRLKYRKEFLKEHGCDI